DSTEATPAESAREVRVRVANDPASRRESFRVGWIDAQGKEVGAPVDAYVPPGESRVVKVPRPADPAKARALRLQGDAHPFDNTLFAPLAGAQFNDFTKIRFWKHRRLDPKTWGDARVLARFEGGDPAVVEKPIGRGRLVVLASGWGPADSQLARSSKFVPLMSSLLDGGVVRSTDAAEYHVNDGVPLPPEGAATSRTVRKPDGTAASVKAGVETFEGT